LQKRWIKYYYVNNTKLIIERGRATAELQLYVGLSEFNDMGFTLHFLRESDTFVDIGANIGVYTILASGVCKSHTISFEPIPSTCNILRDNIMLNRLAQNVEIYNCGIGEEESVLSFSKDLDSINHVVIDKEEIETIDIKVKPLDEMLVAENPSLMKIDVEGFETPVIKGAKKVLRKESLKAIIIELNGSSSRYGFDETVVHQTLIDYGFRLYSYNLFIRDLKEIEIYGSHNTI